MRAKSSKQRCPALYHNICQKNYDVLRLLQNDLKFCVMKYKLTVVNSSNQSEIFCSSGNEPSGSHRIEFRSQFPRLKKK